MRTSIRTLVGVSAAASALLALAAGPATAQCETSTLLPIPLGVTTFYYDDRSELPPVPGIAVGPSGTWIYEEANGSDSLQRGGTQWALTAAGLGDQDAEICVQSSSPDKLWL
jgi:hypothetical protein